MFQLNAFATPEYPVLFSVLTEPDEGLPDGHVGISLALLVDGIPSFIATHLLRAEDLGPVVASLEGGDVRIAVIGLSVELAEEASALGLDPEQEHPAAFVSVVCKDGRRLNVARIVGRGGTGSPEHLARYVVREIRRGAQIPELVASR